MPLLRQKCTKNSQNIKSHERSCEKKFNNHPSICFHSLLCDAVYENIIHCIRVHGATFVLQNNVRCHKKENHVIRPTSLATNATQLPFFSSERKQKQSDDAVQLFFKTDFNMEGHFGKRAMKNWRMDNNFKEEE